MKLLNQQIHILPELYNCGIWIGAKGTGRTWSLVHLLRHYEESSIVDKKVEYIV